MARRKRKWRPIGNWLRAARKEAGLTLAELERLTNVSISALGRFESDRAVPSFDDVCLIAQQLGWPLLYFATGRERTGNDRLALTAQLYYWGLRDVSLPERLLIGEVRAFEDLAAEVLAGDPSSRVIEAFPGLLLRNKLEPAELIAYGRRYGSLRRLGWLADVAAVISDRIPREYIHPDASRWLSAVVASARDEGTANEIDHIFPIAKPSVSAKRAWSDSPPLTRRWKIACDITLLQFQSRTLSILERTHQT